jgi:tetratricopeptide (TPR) repeat protein
MADFDDFPKRSKTHELETAAGVAFEARIQESHAFVVQGADRNDYGTDTQIEVVDGGAATNVRVHVQLKGTEKALNSDGSLSIAVSRTNLNYLLMQDHSFYVAYHAPSTSLRICTADQVFREYEHRGTAWTEQDSITVTFTEELTVGRLRQIAQLARTGTKTSRDRRLKQWGAPVQEVSKTIVRAPADVHVPDSEEAALEILKQLLDKGADDVISASFDKFEAVLGASTDGMMIAYMAEINLGMANRSRHPKRIEDALVFFQSRQGKPPFQAAGLHYTIGNAFSALRREEQAKTAYQAALADADTAGAPDFAAQVHKNLGTSFERLGQQDEAIEHYQMALALNPDLPEAHNALANYLIRLGRFAEALVHLDQIVFAEASQGKTTSMMGWRANVLFNVGDGRAAFRDINTLVAQADSADWIWPWCARLVASFGRDVDVAAQALSFWQRYVRAFPDHSAGRRELLLTALFIRDKTGQLGKTFEQFREEFQRHISNVDPEDAALLWDRLGHWAQHEGNWEEAEKCFRQAFELDGGHYGHCLGTALNFLSRFQESLPLLLEQAHRQQPDAMSWLQVAIAHEHLGHISEAIEAYEKAIAIDPDYAIAMFDLGGLYWNTGNIQKASNIWKIAVGRFPEHELAAKVKKEFPQLL